MESIEQRLVALVAYEFGLDAQRIHKDMSLRDQGDSLDWFSLVTALEDSFGIQIGDDVGKRLNTVGDLLNLIAEQVPA